MVVICIYAFESVIQKHPVDGWAEGGGLYTGIKLEGGNL